MSSMSTVAELSKYLKTLPRIEYTLIEIVILSFIIGSVTNLINLTIDNGLVNNIIYGSIYGLTVLGISSILSGFLNQLVIDAFHGINLKIKHSMFISLITLSFFGIILLIGSIISKIINLDLYLNFLILGFVLVYGFNTLVFWATTKVRFTIATLTALIQPLLTLLLYIIMNIFFNQSIEVNSFLSTIGFKVILSSAVLILALFSFIKVIDAPFKKNLGIDVLDLLSLFIAHINEGSDALEELFETMGETIETVVTFVSFKTQQGIKSLFISPSVHPGPIGNLGGSNMPTILANKFNHFTMVAHGPSTHDFNPVAISEIEKIEKSVKNALKNINYSNKCSKFIRYTHEKATIGVQFFNEGIVILSTFAPQAVDDIEFGVGLTMMGQSRNHCNVKDSIIVDCHNSFTPESGEVLPGNEEVFQLMEVIDLIKTNPNTYEVKVGCYENTIGTLGKNEGIGESGIKTMVVEVDNQRTAYVLFDSNNMEHGFRQEIIDAVSNLDIDEIEVMTTDTHSVNTLSRGYNPVGIDKRDDIIEYVKISIQEAIKDLEKVEVGTGTEKIKNLKTFGPNNSTELITTISSVVAVSKIIAPVLLITALTIIFFWIF